MKKYKLLSNGFILDQETGTSFSPKSSLYGIYEKWKAEGNTADPADIPPEPTYKEKRMRSIADGGYGTIREQLEYLGEQGIGAFQSHVAKIKLDHPKDV